MMWYNGCYSSRKIVKVTGVTNTLIKVHGYRFRRFDGYEPGTHRPSGIKVPTPEDLQELALDNEERILLAFIKSRNWDAYDMDTLRAVRNCFPV